MAIIWFIFIIFPYHSAVYMYKIMILQKPLSQFPPNFTLILLLKCDDNLFKWSCSIDCQAHIFFFKTKNCSNDDIFISCDDRIGKMLHNICMSAVAMSLRWANHGPWASCSHFSQKTWFDNNLHEKSKPDSEKYKKSISICHLLKILPRLLRKL